MKNINPGFRIASGFALISFLFPFYKIAILYASESVSGLKAAFGGKVLGEDIEPLGMFIPLLFLLISFVISFRKKPTGKWVGVFPLLSFLFLASNFQSASFPFGSVEPQWGLVFAILASLVASVLGFLGKTPGLPDTPDNSASSE
jgi:hypothetical protein